MNIRKIRFDMLVENTSVSIERIKNQITNSDAEINSVKKLIEQIALLNEKDSFVEENDLPATNSKKNHQEISSMLEVVLRLFAEELGKEAKKSHKIKDILK